jgi:hypothetical protein
MYPNHLIKSSSITLCLFSTPNPIPIDTKLKTTTIEVTQPILAFANSGLAPVTKKAKLNSKRSVFPVSRGGIRPSLSWKQILMFIERQTKVSAVKE